ncbi:MAG: hypothetical protein WBA12_07760, partial [Catalinimonas sp.]
MKKFLLLALALWTVGTARAQAPVQPDGVRGWFQPGQSYLRIPVAEDGLYRLDRTALTAAGVPAGIESTWRLFHRGAEQAIRVADDGSHFEFWGQRNDGTLDAFLYEAPTDQPHPYGNLFSDTAAYYLTWGGAAGKRMQNLLLTPAIPPEAAHGARRRVLFEDEYALGKGQRVSNNNFHRSDFEEGEGWTGPRLVSNSNTNVTDRWVGPVADPVGGGGATLRLAVQVMGRNFNEDQEVQLFAGPSAADLSALGTLQFSTYEVVTDTFTVPFARVNAQDSLLVRVQVLEGTNASLSYLDATYQRRNTWRGERWQRLTLPARAGGLARVVLSNAPAGLQVLDVTDPNNVRRLG